MFQEHQILTVSKLLKSLSNPNRLKILCTLLDQSASVTTIVEACDVSQSAISQHLKVLKDDGLVDCVRERKMMMYQIKDEKIRNILHVLKDNYCQEEI